MSRKGTSSRARIAFLENQLNDFVWRYPPDARRADRSSKISDHQMSEILAQAFGMNPPRGDWSSDDYYAYLSAKYSVLEGKPAPDFSKPQYVPMLKEGYVRGPLNEEEESTWPHVIYPRQ